MNQSPGSARRSISGDIVTRRTAGGSRYRVTEGPVAPRHAAPVRQQPPPVRPQPAPAPRRPAPPLDLRQLEPRPTPAPRPLWSGPEQPARPAPAQVSAPSPATALPSAPAGASATAPATKQRPARLWNLAQYPLVAAAALIAAFNVQAGQLFVLAWGVYALIRKVDPRYSFGAALFILITIPLFQALGRAGIAENAAVYVYELLVVGTISALIALRKSE